MTSTDGPSLVAQGNACGAKSWFEDRRVVASLLADEENKIARA
jgi:hypothetical protein